MMDSLLSIAMNTVHEAHGQLSMHGTVHELSMHGQFHVHYCMPCITVRGLLLADRPDMVAQTSHDHTNVLFNRVCGCHWKLLQNPAQITSLVPLWAGASVQAMVQYSFLLQYAGAARAKLIKADPSNRR